MECNMSNGGASFKLSFPSDERSNMTTRQHEVRNRKLGRGFYIYIALRMLVHCSFLLAPRPCLPSSTGTTTWELVFNNLKTLLMTFFRSTLQDKEWARPLVRTAPASRFCFCGVGRWDLPWILLIYSTCTLNELWKWLGFEYIVISLFWIRKKKKNKLGLVDATRSDGPQNKYLCYGHPVFIMILVVWVPYTIVQLIDLITWKFCYSLWISKPGDAPIAGRK